MEDRKFTAMEISILLNVLKNNNRMIQRLIENHPKEYEEALNALVKDGYVYQNPLLTAKGNMLVNAAND